MTAVRAALTFPGSSQPKQEATFNWVDGLAAAGVRVGDRQSGEDGGVPGAGAAQSCRGGVQRAGSEVGGPRITSERLRGEQTIAVAGDLNLFFAGYDADLDLALGAADILQMALVPLALEVKTEAL
jgi:hypothetical protein